MASQKSHMDNYLKTWTNALDLLRNNHPNPHDI